MKLLYNSLIALSLLFCGIEASHSNTEFHPNKLLKKEELSIINTVNKELHNKQYHKAHEGLNKLLYLIKIRASEFEKMIPDIIDPTNINRQIQVTKSKFLDAIRYLRLTTEAWLERYIPVHDKIMRKTAYEFAQNINNPKFTWDQAKRLLMDNDAPNTFKLQSDIISPLLNITFVLRSIELDFAVAHLRDYYYIRTDHSNSKYHRNVSPFTPAASLTPGKPTVTTTNFVLPSK